MLILPMVKSGYQQLKILEKAKSYLMIMLLVLIKILDNFLACADLKIAVVIS